MLADAAENLSVWEYAKRGPRSLSGVTVEGDKLVRFVYLDESGTSKERVVVVAGVIMDADRDWRLVEDYLLDLIEEYIPEEHRSLAAPFHACEMFHGQGIFDPRRSNYPQEKAHEALKKLLGIPALFHLPIVCGHMVKSEETGLDKYQRQERLEQNQAIAFALCALAAERYMKAHASPLEVASLFAENNKQTWKAIKKMHLLLRGKGARSLTNDAMLSLLLEIASDCLPVRRIVDTVSFQDKDDALFLQIADACALVIRYFYEGNPKASEFINALTLSDPVATLGAQANTYGFRFVTWA